MTVLTAPTAAPNAVPNAVPNAAVAEADAVDLAFLGWTSAEFRARAAAWARDEARLAGADHVLRELVPWTGEDATGYRARLAQAKYLNFAQMHAGILSGHLERAAPMPGRGVSLPTLGELRDRPDQHGQPTLAEAFWDGADGTGPGAASFRSLAAGIQKRACATGHRWTLVEMPALADIRAAQRRAYRPGDTADALDVAHGFRPYLIEYSPRVVPYAEVVRGALHCAILRVPVADAADVALGAGRPSGGPRLGYYVLVRRGCTRFGEYFAGGGWWLFDAERRPATAEGGADGAAWRGTFDDCDGEIPMLALIAATDDAALDVAPHGTWGEGAPGAVTTAGAVPSGAPALYRLLYGTDYAAGPWAAGGVFSRGSVVPTSRSLIMELGQIGVNLMNRMSEGDANYSQACRSITFVVGSDPGDPGGVNLTVAKVEVGSIIVPVPAWHEQAGAAHAPTLWNSSASLVDANALAQMVTMALAQAREVMVRQLTSDAATSGASKRVEFATGASPMLAHMLQHRASWEQTVFYYVGRRAGATHAAAWQATSDWPREIELRPVVDDIDAMLGTLEASGLTSRTLAAKLVTQAARERGLWPTDDVEGAAIDAELAAVPPAPNPFAPHLTPGAAPGEPMPGGTTPAQKQAVLDAQAVRPPGRAPTAAAAAQTVVAAGDV